MKKSIQKNADSSPIGGENPCDNSLQTDRQKLIKELEKKGEFNSHLSPPDWENAKPFGAEFPYIPRGIKRLKYALINFFVVSPFRRHKAKSVYKVKTVGRENLAGLNGAVAISNHIAVFDCMALSFALKSRRLKFVAAEFNNKKGWFGEAMRAHGILPLSPKFPVLKKFNSAFSHYLERGDLVLIYPEESMWDNYPKPRPFKNGAFFYAAKFGVPVLPIFITLRQHPHENKSTSRLPKQNTNAHSQKSESDAKNGDRKYFTVNIAPPIYPNPGLSIEQNTTLLRDKAYAACVEIYERTYNKKLTYGCD